MLRHIAAGAVTAAAFAMTTALVFLTAGQPRGGVIVTAGGKANAGHVAHM